MAINMHHCRCQNTLAALNEVYRAIEDVEELSEEEKQAHAKLVKLCKKFFDLHDEGEED